MTERLGSEGTKPSVPAPKSGRRVVITGLGMINPLGSTLEQVWQCLNEGKSGIRQISAFDSSTLTTRIAGEVLNFNGKDYIPKGSKEGRKALRIMARGIQMAVSGAQVAIDDAQIDKSAIDPTRFGVIFGSGLLATELDEIAGAAEVSANCKPGVVDLEKWGTEGIAAIPPLWMLKYLPNMLACHVSILHNAQGPNNTITESEVASLLALGEASRIIRRNGADFFLTGGAESKMNPLSMVRQCLFGAISQRNEEPEKACRPFDKNRDGFVIGEGAGVIAIEELEHAKSRGARIYAELVGFGAAFDRNRDGRGLARAIRAAMEQAQVTPNDIDHINAHGLATVQADIWESKAIREVFGENQQDVPVFAAKSYFGNLGAGSGTSELITSILAMHHQCLPRTLNYSEPDPECPVSVLSESKKITNPFFLKTGFTDMGQCAAVVCRTWE